MKKYIALFITLIIISHATATAQVSVDYMGKGWGRWMNGEFVPYPLVSPTRIVSTANGLVASRSSHTLNITVYYAFQYRYGSMLEVFEVWQGTSGVGDRREEYKIPITIGQTKEIIISLVGEKKTNSILSVTFKEVTGGNKYFEPQVNGYVGGDDYIFDVLVEEF